jgi:hypothetical protein
MFWPCSSKAILVTCCKNTKVSLKICYVHYLACDSVVFIKYRENYAKFDILKFVDCDLPTMCNYVYD